MREGTHAKRGRLLGARGQWLFAVVVGLLAWTCTDVASATAAQSVRYSLAQVYSGAVRYLRIDLGYDITEKDPETAYLLFRYRGEGKQSSFGAIEIVQATDSVRLVIKLPKLPSYHEAVLRDGLVRKLQEDYGPEPNRPKPERKPPDEGSKEESPQKGQPREPTPAEPRDDD